MTERAYTPPLGTGSTADYDRALRRWTREMVWREAMLGILVPRPGEVILDMGCGTGSFAIMLKQRHPDVSVIAIDPDSEALEIAERKAEAVNVEIDWRHGFGGDVQDASADAVISSLVLHQMPVAAKSACLATMHAAVRPGSRMLVADYGFQAGLMRFLFSMTIQLLDGVEDTQPNADGILPLLFEEAGFADIACRKQIRTWTGMIEIFSGHRRWTRS